MNNKDWKIPYDRPELPPSLLSAGYSPLLSAMLALRGIKTAAQAQALLDCGEAALYDPLLMCGMAQARARVLDAISGGEHVAVYGDYDVDGITSTCLVTDYLRSRGLTCTPYIPDRNEEGYGLNCGALDSLHAQGVRLVITVDCGITAASEVSYAASLGMDMIITDHHECGGDLPQASAVIDCKRDGETYPNTCLAGVGVAFKLVCAVDGDAHRMLERYADLVAIGTVADVMPLSGENRCLVRIGLKKLETDPRPGIAAMLRESGVEQKRLTASVIGYTLAPRLNAAGRLGHASTAGELILCDDAKRASELAGELCELNRRRQNIETGIWEDANAQLASTVPDAPIVLASESWHQGVIGIAASRLAKEYSLPAIMICLNGDVGKGSCRSFGNFNLFNALSACSDQLIDFGGHALAAGLNIRREKLDDFRRAMEEYYRSNRPDPVCEVQCDMLINDPALLSVENVQSLEALEPFGNANPKPLFCISGAELETLTAVGGGKHLRMRIRLKGVRFECIFFSQTAQELGISEGDSIDLAFTPQINEYRGHVSVQLLTAAARVHDGSGLCREILRKNGSALYAAAPFCPERSDFVQVWRSIDGGVPVGDCAESVLAQCPPELESERYCLCLMALLEAGLIEGEGGGVFGAHPAQVDGKVDLQATELIKTLKAM